MKERPILFSAPMVRAILDGRKTQARRIVKPQPSNGWKLICPGLCDQKPVLGEITSKHPKRGRFGVFTVKQRDGFTERDLIVCPYGQPGDRLWVREAFSAMGDKSRQASPIFYRADRATDNCGWTPSIHMPRWASRILLEITDVRVERLQDISEEDACAEGIECEPCDQTVCFKNYMSDNWIPAWGDKDDTVAILSFESLWESINGQGSWQANPWVWVVEFKVVDPKS